MERVRPNLSEAGPRVDNGFEERSCIFQVQANGRPQTLAGTRNAHSNCDVYITTFGDAACAGATVNVYARIQNGLCLLDSFVLASSTQTQRFTVSAAADGFDVELVPAAQPTGNKCQVTLLAYGYEGSCCAGASPDGGGETVYAVPFTYASGTVVVGPLEVGQVVNRVDVAILVPFNGDDPAGSVEVGNLAALGAYLPSSDVDTLHVGQWGTVQLFVTAAATSLVLTVAGGNSTAGSGMLLVKVK